MSLRIGDAISNGFEKLTTTAGLQLALASIVLSLITTLGTNSLVVAVDAGAGGGMGQEPVLVLPIGLAGGAVLAFLGGIASVVLSLIVYRTMARPLSELDSLPHGVTDSLVVPTIFLIITSIVVGISVFVGLIFLIIPGIFLAISFVFAQVYVAIEDQNPFEAMSSSWGLAKGNRLSIFLLGLVLLGIGLVIAIVGGIAGFISPLFSTLVSLLISPFISIFTSAVIVDAYLQLKRESSDAGSDEPATATPA